MTDQTAARDRAIEAAGVPTADVAVCGLCGHTMTQERCGYASADGVRLCHTDDHSCYHRWTVYGERPAAPEGVDAVDEPQPHRCEYKDDLARAMTRIERMADELTAAQAAIQRVRELHTPSDEGDFCRECGSNCPCPTVRALDGDTTEES
jgi:hypothetical protein